MNEKITKLALSTAKGLASSVPIVGNLLSEYIGLTTDMIADKRMRDWMTKVEKVLEKIPKSIQELAESEEIYTYIQISTMGAMRSNQEEKRKLFAAALYQSIIDINLSADKKIFYLNLLDKYTLSHIRLLKYFSNDNFSRKDNASVSKITFREIKMEENIISRIVEDFPEFKDDISFMKHLIGQLISDNLLGIIDFETPISVGQIRKKTTKYGDDFLKFIIIEEEL